MKTRKLCPIDNCGECKYSNWFVKPVVKIRCKILKKVVSTYGECSKEPDKTGAYKILFDKTPKRQGIHKDCPLRDYKEVGHEAPA